MKKQREQEAEEALRRHRALAEEEERERFETPRKRPVDNPAHRARFGLDGAWDVECRDVCCRIPKRELYARIPISFAPDPEIERLKYRRKRMERLMLKQGMRPESVQKYLRRGFMFDRPFIRAVHEEIGRMAVQMKAEGKLARRRLKRHLDTI